VTAAAVAGVGLLCLLIGQSLLVESAALGWVCPGESGDTGDSVVVGRDFI